MKNATKASTQHNCLLCWPTGAAERQLIGCWEGRRRKRRGCASQCHADSSSSSVGDTHQPIKTTGPAR